ncbi:muconolactone Delta-isomerase [Streptomyces sp. NPDC090052]|uniref:muconolactone Delta-isomerase n=1 Tax=unclassified Streptomyces TaxID=2593676 RepID=UPI002252A365|nr:MULTISPECIES: muconolactone Delta-isomerase [unclassified Streptomyces]MCX4728089.1 muconolactone Delta-isomerase [Streptomyces sp. NBC_01306]WSV02685.1 muconolactone Delta-isomerase [Streptomyces sp. NBC_01020]WSX40755.1 muconolactone Delta-isomerase [Streptomyces sp. NBC_00963]WSX71277.1 muconolactone Delta-isomerase [Streptomyces sp. NBC_00932]
MLFAVNMDVAIPHDLAPEVREDLIAREKAYCQALQRDGVWVHIWRCTGQYANLSVFDVADNDELHSVLWNLPLFRYMSVSVTPLSAHPSALHGSGAAVA